jgi:hypothetical protein
MEASPKKRSVPPQFGIGTVRMTTVIGIALRDE